MGAAKKKQFKKTIPYRTLSILAVFFCLMVTYQNCGTYGFTGTLNSVTGAPSAGGSTLYSIQVSNPYFIQVSSSPRASCGTGGQTCTTTLAAGITDQNGNSISNVTITACTHGDTLATGYS